jgi:hypothetical protein
MSIPASSTRRSAAGRRMARAARLTRKRGSTTPGGLPIPNYLAFPLRAEEPQVEGAMAARGDRRIRVR